MLNEEVFGGVSFTFRSLGASFMAMFGFFWFFFGFFLVHWYWDWELKRSWHWDGWTALLGR